MITRYTKERTFPNFLCHSFAGFKEKQKLRRHMLVHTGEKSHSCDLCGRAFALKHNLTSHMRIHNGKGRFCRYCGKMFTQGKNMREHESDHASVGHRATQDKVLQLRQVLAPKARGRTSLMEMDRRREEEKRRRMEREEEEEEEGKKDRRDSGGEGAIQKEIKTPKKTRRGKH